LFRNLSIIIGALAPLTQTNLKRLLAYSSINHMGLLLMPLCSAGSSAIASLWIHMFIYILINLGVWSLLMVQYVRPNQPSVKVAGPQYIWDLKGLNQSSRSMAFAWAVFMVRLRGLPPVYGFLGKAAIILSSLQNALTITVAVA
jgi:NADH-quinone oxidoreductase subunit N